MVDGGRGFVWYELMADDLEAAAAFYGAVVGWTGADAGLPDRRYTILSAGGRGVAGAMAMPDDARAAGARPAWIAYIASGDVEGDVAKSTAAGGHVRLAPVDIPGVGRIAILGDPQGATFGVFAPAGAAPPPPAAHDSAGMAGWHELHAKEWQAAFAFYADLFGWEKTGAVEMGPMGTYLLFGVAGTPVGGMMTSPNAQGWLYYFTVTDIDAAAARVTGAGGMVLNGPIEVPGGSWIIQCKDPQGAAFALVTAAR